MNLNEANKISDLIEYQKDSVVSKTLIKKEKGTITIFAFDQAQGLSEHTAPFDALVQVVDGKADILLNGKSNIVTEGEMIIMPANVPHALKAIEKFKMMLVMIRE
ncbi:MAG: cupin domain-containing protein [Candidatus Marinimicrobia bacterium]|nr:cupin domain-containing protein [Candidatus Neomarinimicrobiota bacterium]